jgi:hypothetical protein
MAWVLRHEVLMIGFGRKETERFDLCGNRLLPISSLIQLRDIGAGCISLGCIIRENSRAILRASVGPLAIQLRGIMRHRKEYVQQIIIANARRVIMNADRFCVFRLPSTDKTIISGRLGIA